MSTVLKSNQAENSQNDAIVEAMKAKALRQKNSLDNNIQLNVDNIFSENYLAKHIEFEFQFQFDFEFDFDFEIQSEMSAIAYVFVSAIEVASQSNHQY